MKKLILSSLVMASLSFAANAVTYMNVKTDDGSVVRYGVEHVTEVYFTEESETPADEDQGVTVSGKEGLYTYVDLGLTSGIKWATYNVGATRPTEYGDYFAWGETMQQLDSVYTEESYKYGDLHKYNTDSIYGTVDNKMVLEAEDDAATANWGSAWRMPTAEEIDELIEGCEWEWIENFDESGVNGQLGTSKTTGATIFLPAAGMRYDFELLDAGDYAYYWSSSLDEDDPNNAYHIDFGGFYIKENRLNRYFGQNVRAVLR